MATSCSYSVYGSKDLSIVVSGQRVLAADPFFVWQAAHVILDGDREIPDCHIGKLLFVYHALFARRSGEQTLVAEEDEQGKQWRALMLRPSGPQGAWQYQGGAGSARPIQVRRRDASKILATPALTLKDVAGEEVVLVANSTPGQWADFKGSRLTLQHPIFFNRRCSLSRKQRKALPALFMCAEDFATVSDARVTHAGAFGSDFDHLSFSDVCNRFTFDKSTFDPRRTQQDWVVVWKFPWDLNQLPSYDPIIGIPMPVGFYPLLDDFWWAPPEPVKVRSQLQKDQSAVFKMRSDLETGRPSVQHLEDDLGNKVAMITTHFHIKGFWESDWREDYRPRVVAVLEQLFREVGLYAFSCYSQHHAIVFYYDRLHNAVVTPAHLCRILQDPRRGPSVMSALKSTAFDPALIDAWSDSYKLSYAE